MFSSKDLDLKSLVLLLFVLLEQLIVVIYYSIFSDVISPLFLDNTTADLLVNFMQNERTPGNSGMIPPTQPTQILHNFTDITLSPLRTVDQILSDMQRQNDLLYNEWVWIENPKLYYEEYLKTYKPCFQEQ